MEKIIPEKYYNLVELLKTLSTIVSDNTYSNKAVRTPIYNFITKNKDEIPYYIKNFLFGLHNLGNFNTNLKTNKRIIKNKLELHKKNLKINLLISFTDKFLSSYLYDIVMSISNREKYTYANLLKLHFDNRL